MTVTGVCWSAVGHQVDACSTVWACRAGRAGRLVFAGVPGRALLDGWLGQAASGGLLAAVAICSQAVYQGQSVGRCRVSLRAEWLLVNVPARLALLQRKATLHLPEHWPWANTWTRLWQQVFTPGSSPPAPA